MAFRHRFGLGGRSNCLVFVAGLALRGRLAGLLVCWRGRWTLPHFMGVTRAGNVVHFKADQHPYELWWPGQPEEDCKVYFPGRPQALPRCLFKNKGPYTEIRWSSPSNRT